MTHHLHYAGAALKGGFVGGLIAAASTPIGDVENHYITVGKTVAIVLCVAAACWKVSATWTSISNSLENLEKFMIESGVDRKGIHAELTTIKTKIASLRCHPDNGTTGCCEAEPPKPK